MGTTANTGVFDRTLWAKELIRNLDKSGVMLDCVNTDYEAEVKQGSKQVNIFGAGAITVSDRGTTAMTYTDPNGSKKELVINQEKVFGFKVHDIAKAQTNVKFMSRYIQNAKKSIVIAKDTFLMGKYTDVPEKNTLTAVTATKANIYDTFVDLNQALTDSYAIDTDGKGADGKLPWAVVDTKTLALIKKSDEFTHATKIGDENIRRGAVGEFGGFLIKCTTNPVTLTGGKHLVLVGTTEAITFANQIADIKSLEDKDDPFMTYVAGLYTYGAVTEQPDCLARVDLTIS